LQLQVNKRLIADVIREIAEKRLSGKLSFSRENSVRAILFDAGEPVSVSSNLPAEQIEHKLIKDGRAAPGLIETAKRRDNDSELLGRALVEIGVVSEEVMLEYQREVAEQIIRALFEWEEFEFVFEPFERAYGFGLNISSADCILMGTRHVSEKKVITDTYAPLDGLIQAASLDISHFAFSAKLNMLESYVFSRINTPTRVSEISALVGMPDRETLQAICALVALGLVKLVSPGEKVIEENKQDSVARLLEGISRKIQFFASASFYEVLGVPKMATTTAINKAFDDLKEMVAFQRSQYPDHRELHTNLDHLLGRMQEAHTTLSDPDKRRLYDMPAARKPAPPVATPTSASIERGGPEAMNSSNPAIARPVQPTKPQIINTPQQAAQHYQQGRSRYEQKDIHAAEHLFREAVRLDPSQPHYHYHLAVTLMILSQARHEHTHHEGCHVTCNMGGGLVSNPRVRYEAEQHLLRAAELDPSNIKVRLTLGLLYKEAGLAKKAENSFREALMLDGRNSVARRELGLTDGKENE
jgi:tetratricopeptide (TPR) repeat protein